MTYLDIVRAQLKEQEGVKLKPYRDTVGKLTIGVGRNLDDVGISGDECEVLLDSDLKRAEGVARAVFPALDQLSENRRAVLVNMAFNLGMRLNGFIRLKAAIESNDFDLAAAEMMNSYWSTQVGRRAQVLANLMKAG